ncbi:MAG: hypothetical protein AAGC47_10645 [Bacteroidota bacterium]
MSDLPKTGKNAAVAFFVFSIIAVVAGIFLIAMGDYFIGVAGTISSFGLSVICFKNLKKTDQ